jgi:hypothetical protein
MVRFHQLLLDGHSPSAALALTQSEHRIAAFRPEELAARSPAALQALAASGFVCFGTGRSSGFSDGARAWRSHVHADRPAAKITK